MGNWSRHGLWGDLWCTMLGLPWETGLGTGLGGVESILPQSHIGRTAGAEEDRGQRGPGAFRATVALVG